MSHAESLAAHNAMRVAFESWMREPNADLFDLALRLNSAAALAVKGIKNARRD